MLGDTQPGAFPEGISASQQAGLVRPEVCGLCGPVGRKCVAQVDMGSNAMEAFQEVAESHGLAPRPAP